MEHAIRNAPVPTDVPSLRSFLGLASYYSKFLPNFSSVTAPLRALTRKGILFVWTPEADIVFIDIKGLIIKNVSLQLFDSDLPVIVAPDASAYGLVTVLLQVKDGSTFLVAFASQSLSSTEWNYSVGEKEALAYLWPGLWEMVSVHQEQHYRSSVSYNLVVVKRVWTPDYVNRTMGNASDAADELSRLPCSYIEEDRG